MICNHEDDPKTSNGYFCKVLCGLCEKGNECCIAKHLGCDTSGWAINQSSFLRGEGKELYDDDNLTSATQPPPSHREVKGKAGQTCMAPGCGDLEESLDRLLTKVVGLNK